jgi:hypothetical protein
MLLEAIPQSQINHIVIVELPQAGLFGFVEKHIYRGNFPIVADFIFCEDLAG